MIRRRFAWTIHAQIQASARGLSNQLVESVLEAPDRIEAICAGRAVVQRRFVDASGPYLLRVFVDLDREPAEIVTVYRTSKLRKYGGQP